jgi:hypothetical protein
MFSGCCGQPARRRARKAAPEENLPENPAIDRGGVRLLYLGAGRRDFQGAQTGLRYVVSDHRRAFVAHPDDAGGLLRDRFVIEAP